VSACLRTPTQTRHRMLVLSTPAWPVARRRIDRAVGRSHSSRVVTCVRGAAPPAATRTAASSRPRRAEARARGRLVARARGFLQNLEELREEPAGESPPPPPAHRHI
jgi:hypothetical protein